MSLRLLLADESPSIKRAFSLALKDYGVKIQTVQQGTDVSEIFNRFDPDICFMDILLPKLNGYDASKVLKTDSSSQNTPVVLMWSGFMELDDDKFAESKADASLEKPFETETLRALVKKLVPKLNDNAISDHLILDEVSDMTADERKAHEALSSDFDAIEDTPIVEIPSLGNSDAGSGLSKLTDVEDLNLSHLNAQANRTSSDEDDVLSFPDLPDLDGLLEDDNDLSSFEGPEGLNITPLAKDALDEIASGDDEEWMTEDLKKIDSDGHGLSPEGLDDVDSFSIQKLNESADDDASFDSNLPPTPDKISVLKEAAKVAAIETLKEESPNYEDTTLAKPASKSSIEPLKEESPSSVEPLKEDHESELISKENIPQMSKEELKRLILAQSKDIIESVVWDVVPELAKEMIQKEIKRLTGEIKYEDELR